RNTFSIGTYGNTIDIDTAGGDYTSDKWLKIIGCDSTVGNPLPYGQYVILDGENLLTGHIINISNMHMVHIENIHFTRASASGKAGCYLTASGLRFGFNFINCKFSYCSYGLYANSINNRNICVSRCIFSGNTSYDFWSVASMPLILGNFFDSVCPAIYASFGASVQGSLFKYGQDSGTAITVNGASSQRGEAIILNCTFYCIGTGGVTTISCNNLVGPVLANNIIYLAQPASDIPVSAARISYEDYNCTNATVHILTGPHSLNGTDPQFADAANGNFRPRNPLVLRGGMPDTTDNPTQIGVIQSKYQFISKARAVNPGRGSIFK
ncbi:MAG: hypothetical protein WCE45_11170, partial [Sedimentisphaerales bacterium]